MNKDNAKDYLPLIQALAEGKTIQFFSGSKWNDVEDVSFSYEIKDYRIKPEVEYVPFDTTEGKPKWHDLRKDPNDLPKEDCETVTLHENGNKNIIKWKHGEWINAIVVPVIAWCELPKFEE